MNLPKVLIAAALLGGGALSVAGNLSVTSSAAPGNFSLTGAGVQDTFVFTPTISANTVNYNLRAAAVTAGWNQVKPLTATVTISPGVVLSSASTGSYAFDTGTGFPSFSSLKLINKGFIYGSGGAGGASPPGGELYGNGGPGGAGGAALKAQSAISIENLGVVGGGGGGGGGGSSVNTGKGDFLQGGTGGSGQGFVGGAINGPNGGTTSNGNSGGSGGTFGNAGGAGQNNTFSGGAGGAAGSAVIGNSFITWTATGTRLGPIN